jgi:hypothetical protein
MWFLENGGSVAMTEKSQADSEPMMSITVRQRDWFLYKIRELEAENQLLRAKIAGMKLEGKGGAV